MLAATAALPGHAADSPGGVFSNKAEGFGIKTVILDKNGKGLYFAAVAFVPVLWKHDPATNIITLTGPIGVNATTTSMEVRFEPMQRQLLILDPKRSEGSGPLLHISDEIPPWVGEALKSFNGVLQKADR